MLSFLLRLVGQLWTNSKAGEETFCDLLSSFSMPSQPRRSVAYDPSEVFGEEGLIPLDGNLPAARAGRRRRAAIDLVRSSKEPPSEPGRSSMDTIASRRPGATTAVNYYTNFATVHKGRLTKIVKANHTMTENKVVLKIYDKSLLSAVQLDDVEKEIEILKMAKGCAGIVEFENAFEDEFFSTVVLRNCPGGNLLDRVAATGGRMGEEMCVRNVVKPLVDALVWLHERDIVHRDVKPEHILFDDAGELRLTDYLSAAVRGKTTLANREGSLPYMAPEVLSKPTDEEIFHEVIDNGISETDLPSYDEKVDVWSLGVVVVEILTGHQPFRADTAEDLAKVQLQELRGDRWGGVLDFIRDQEFLSLQGQDFLSSILQINPQDRPSAKVLQGHPWLEMTGSEDGDCQVG